jgi:succinyl-CoA---D-citramalate CoA-transferase
MISISKLNSNILKPAITLNLQSQKGQSLLHRLIPHFDVQIENHRPDVMKRLGCSCDELNRYRPGSIML